MSSRSRGPPDWLKGLKRAVYNVGERRQAVPTCDDASEGLRLISASAQSYISATATLREHSRLDKPSEFEVVQLRQQQPSGLLGQGAAEARAFFLDTKLNLLMLAFPFAIVSKASGWGDATTFVFSMIALCPLAERLGFVTEQLALYTNDTLGGLLNASFGNATEVIISGFALKRGYMRIVQLSLLGSVVSNLLLVLGTAFIAGGLKYSSQRFNQQGINMNCALLLLGVVAVLLPSLLSETQSEARENSSELALSRFEALFLLVIYACYLVFQLVTHRFLYEDGGGGGKEAVVTTAPGAAANSDLEGGVAGGLAGRASGYSGAGEGTVGESSSSAMGPTMATQRNLTGRPLAAAGAGMSGVELPVRTGAGASLCQSSGRLVPDTASGGNSADLLDHDGGASPLGSVAGAGRALRSQQQRGRGARGGDDMDEEEARRPNGAGRPGEAAGAEEEDQEDEEELVLSKVGCFIWLVLVTLCISLLSEWIVGAIKGASKTLKVPMPFLVTILLPIVGNAAEHASAIVFAYKNRIEIALGVAVGSSTQVAVLIVPFCVVLAWMMRQPLDLNFNAFEATVYFFSVLLAIITVQDGTSNWLKGVVLLVAYALVAAGFFMHKDPDLALEDVDAA